MSGSNQNTLFSGPQGLTTAARVEQQIGKTPSHPFVAENRELAGYDGPTGTNENFTETKYGMSPDQASINYQNAPILTQQGTRLDSGMVIDPTLALQKPRYTYQEANNQAPTLPIQQFTTPLHFDGPSMNTLATQMGQGPRENAAWQDIMKSQNAQPVTAQKQKASFDMSSLLTGIGKDFKNQAETIGQAVTGGVVESIVSHVDSNVNVLNKDDSKLRQVRADVQRRIHESKVLEQKVERTHEGVLAQQVDVQEARSLAQNESIRGSLFSIFRNLTRKEERMTDASMIIATRYAQKADLEKRKKKQDGAPKTPSAPARGMMGISTRNKKTGTFGEFAGNRGSGGE
jgi:hypothetical protein